jgi:hypothetical protein
VRIVLIHLSDIHFREKGNPVANRIAQFLGAFRAAEPAAAAYFLAVTGDVAYSGESAEYSVALDFFQKLLDGLRGEFSGAIVDLVVAPGNHDCNFARKDAVRDVILQHIAQDPSILTASGSDELLRICLGVQDEFFFFEALNRSGKEIRQSGERLFYQHTFEVGTQTILIDVYNSAWMSQLHENPGHLYFPIHAIARLKGADAALVIGLIHHPYNWLEPNNKRVVSKSIEAASDIILTAHEHEMDAFSKTKGRSEVYQYLEGGVLQTDENNSSTFNIVVIDFENKQQRVIQHKWNGTIYTAADSEWRQFHRNRRLGNAFITRDEFESELHEIGAGFRHSAKATLSLDDVFVYPDLDNLSNQGKVKEADHRTINSDQVVEFLIEHPRVAIFGADKAGKTSLARNAFQELHRRFFIPIIVKGRDLRNVRSQDAFSEVVNRSVAEAYGKEIIEQYAQLDPKGKALIIDNFDDSGLNRAGQNVLLQLAMRVFERIIITASELFRVEELTKAGEVSDLLEFQQCQIRPFGHKLRAQLIERWMLVGREYDGDDRGLTHVRDQAEKRIEMLLGKSMIPSHPIFVLMMLQVYESQTPLNTAQGLYGYYYEFLISLALQDQKEFHLDTLHTVLANIAYHMFTASLKTLSHQEFSKAVNAYKEKHRMSFEVEALATALENAGILRCGAEGVCQFRYQYIYYYYVALYLARNLHTQAEESAIRAQITDLIANIHVEEYANVLIFLVYLTKDEGTIKSLLAHARSVYGQVPPCDLDQHLEFIKSLTTSSPALQLDGRTTEEHRRERHENADRLEEKGNGITKDEDMDEVVEQASMLNVSFKTLQVMGQVLRNFPGSLSGNLKEELTSESYQLGLRIMTAIGQVMESALPELRIYFGKILQDRFPKETPRDIAQRTEIMLFYLSIGIPYSLIKQISRAVGSQHLKETYEDVLRRNSESISINMIDVSVKLDHFQAFPESEILILWSKVHSHLVQSTILRWLAYDHFYLFPVGAKTIQKICDKLNIKWNTAKLLSRDHKQV